MPLVTFNERVPAPELGRSSLVLAGVFGVAYAGLFVSAAIPSAWTFLAATLVCLVAEIALRRRAPFPSWLLGRLGSGGAWRGLVRGLALLVLLARSDVAPSWTLLAAAGLIALQFSRFAGSALAELLRMRRKMPVVPRGLDLAPVRVPGALPAVFTRASEDLLVLPDVLLLAGGAAALLTGSVRELAAGAGAAVLLVLVGVVVLGAAVLAMERVPKERFTAAVDRALSKVAPEVALYFGGGPENLYQVEMWVETLERLDLPAVIVVRDRESLRKLGPTRVPVLGVEHGNVLMSLELPALRLAVYVAHGANNIHLLRRRGVRHVFLGHGDSDKAVSANPFLKAYDEIWVSGPAAHERFRAADLGLDEDRIVEIGRPQLDVVARPTDEHDSDRLTVLYAPTWEGYDDEPHQTSIGVCGPQLVRLLLDEPDVRVLYRPHPLLGSRDPAVGRAHREIVSLLGDESTPQPADVPEARVRDDLDVARAAIVTTRAERVAALEVWGRKQLRPDGDGGRHRVVPAPQFSLAACFEAADVLLCDVSSVLSDFVASGKPYGVTNPAGLEAAEFAVRYPSSRGGYLVDADGHGLPGLLSAGRGLGDPAAEVRAAVRLELLGPEQPPALERMRAEVERAVKGSR